MVGGGVIPQTQWQSVIDYCRATEEDVGPLVLPSNYDQLSYIEQMFVLANLERVNRGEQPIIGLSNALDALAQQGAANNLDPPAPSSGEYVGGLLGYAYNYPEGIFWGSMYDDGPGFLFTAFPGALRLGVSW